MIIGPGQLFFLPNTTFGQPTFYINQMIARSYQPNGLNLSVSHTSMAAAPSGGELIDCFAAASESGETIVLRCVNDQALAVIATLSLVGAPAGQWAIEVSSMVSLSLSLSLSLSQLSLSSLCLCSARQ